MEIREIIIYLALLMIIQMVGAVGNIAIANAADTREWVIRCVCMSATLIILAAITIALVISFGW